jgi:hypothetical protein
MIVVNPKENYYNCKKEKMRIYTIILFTLLLISNESDAQLRVTPSNTFTQNYVVARDSDVLDATLNLTHNGNSSASYRWRAISTTNSLPSQWDIFEICDPYLCRTQDLLTARHTFVLGANQSGIFKVDFRAFCTSGQNSEISFRIWDSADSANNNQIITFKFTVDAASCFNSISNLTSEDLKLYPNPVKDILTIKGLENSQSTSVQIFNVIGSKVYEKNTKQSDALELNLENLTRGVYLVKIFSEGKHIATKKFTKAD